MRPSGGPDLFKNHSQNRYKKDNLFPDKSGMIIAQQGGTLPPITGIWQATACVSMPDYLIRKQFRFSYKILPLSFLSLKEGPPAVCSAGGPSFGIGWFYPACFTSSSTRLMSQSRQMDREAISRGQDASP